jgi:hypothetical protein
VGQYPHFIPDGYVCLAQGDTVARKLDLYSQSLARHGVHVVDGASNLAAAGREYGINMFPRGGIHWNALAAALATQKLVATANAQTVARPLPQFEFDWKTSYAPIGSDRDLLDLMNLPYPDDHYPVPVLIYRSPHSDPCTPARIAEIGGSFLWMMNTVLLRQTCPPNIDYWFYWGQKRFRSETNAMIELPVDPSARRQSLLTTDVIILEENETSLPESEHAQALLQELASIGATF